MAGLLSNHSEPGSSFMLKAAGAVRKYSAGPSCIRAPDSEDNGKEEKPIYPHSNCDMAMERERERGVEVHDALIINTIGLGGH